MDTIKASNVWDEDYIPPAETDKLRGEKAKLYMELRDLDVQLDNIKYHQVSCRRMYSVCVIIAVALVIIALFLGGVRLFYYRQPVDGLLGYIVNGGITIGVAVAGIASVIFFSAMSVNTFWANCANILRIDKLEIRRLGCIREKSAIEHRLEELERMIFEGKKNS